MAGRTHPAKARVVGISELLVSDVQSDVLITYSLGSCLGVSVFDPVARVGALAHFLLPMSKLDPAKAKDTPTMFVDTGTITMLEQLYALGARRERLEIKAAGGASPIDVNDRFGIGKRNLMVLRKVLWKNDLLLGPHDCGGTLPRTLTLNLSTGETVVTIQGESQPLD